MWRVRFLLIIACVFSQCVHGTSTPKAQDTLYKELLDKSKAKAERASKFYELVEKKPDIESLSTAFHALFEESMAEPPGAKPILDEIAAQKELKEKIPEVVWKAYEVSFRKRVDEAQSEKSPDEEKLKKLMGLSWVIPKLPRIKLLTDLAFSKPLVTTGKEPFNKAQAQLAKLAFYELTAITSQQEALRPHLPKLISTLEALDDFDYPGPLFFVLTSFKDPALDERMLSALKGGDSKIRPETASRYLELRPELYEKALPIALGQLKTATGIPSVAALPLIEIIRGKSSVPERNKIDEAMRLAFPLPKGEADACEVACALVDKVNEWAEPGTDPEKALARTGEWAKKTGSEEAAVRSLGAYFMVKAAPYCPKAKKFAKEWAARIQKDGGWLGVKNDAAAKAAKERSKEETEFLKRAFADASTPDEALKNAQNFLAGIHDRPVAGHYTELYGQIFFSLAVSELKARGELSAGLADEMLLKNETSLTRDTKNFESAMSTYSGSFFNSYGLSSAVLACFTPPANALQRMRDIDAYHEDARMLPYRPTAPPPLIPGETRPSKSEEEKESAFRSAAGRAVVFQLALYQNAKGDAEKKARLDDLNAVLENHLKYSHALRVHALRETKTYLPAFYHMEPDRLAPYYYYPTVPYATAAIQVRLQEKGISDEERAQLKHMRQRFQDNLFAMLKKDGLFRTEFTGLPNHGAKTFDNPLAGLAVLPLIETCDGKPVPPSYGILRTPGVPPPSEPPKETSLAKAPHRTEEASRPVKR